MHELLCLSHPERMNRFQIDDGWTLADWLKSFQVNSAIGKLQFENLNANKFVNNLSTQAAAIVQALLLKRKQQMNFYCIITQQCDVKSLYAISHSANGNNLFISWYLKNKISMLIQDDDWLITNNSVISPVLLYSDVNSYKRANCNL